MIQHMIVQNVLHRPVRAVITVLAVAVEVTLVIIVVGLTSVHIPSVAPFHRLRYEARTPTPRSMSSSRDSCVHSEIRTICVALDDL